MLRAPARSFFIGISILFLVFFTLVPFAAKAVAFLCPESNAACTPKATTQTPCTCVVATYVIFGTCDSPKVCHAKTIITPGGVEQSIASAPFEVTGAMATNAETIGQSWLGQIGTFIEKNPLLMMGGMMIGSQLLSSIMSGGGSSGDSGGTGQSFPVCSGSYYYSETPNPNDPCAVYGPAGGTTNYNSTDATNSGIADLIDLLNKNQQTTNNNTTNTTNTNTQPSILDLLNPSNTTESVADLLNPDTTNNNQTTTGPKCGIGTCALGTYCSAISPGQCIPDGRVDCGSYSCNAGDTCGSGNQCVSTIGGGSLGEGDTYTGDTSIDISEPGYEYTTDDTGFPASVTELISNPELYVDVTGTAPRVSPSQTPLNQKNIPVPKDGISGDIRSFGGGATVFVRARSGNTEVAGFFGGSGIRAVCMARPWSKNFLSYIIPPTFFDGLCKATGFTAGTISTGSSGDGSRVIVSPRGPSYMVQPLQGGVRPEVRIWASPPTVRLGARTSIFWEGRDVRTCQQSSSDGNFSGTSKAENNNPGNEIRGGATTVPLTAPVTFYIVCTGLDDKTISHSTIVNIGI